MIKAGRASSSNIGDMGILILNLCGIKSRIPPNNRNICYLMRKLPLSLIEYILELASSCGVTWKCCNDTVKFGNFANSLHLEHRVNYHHGFAPQSITVTVESKDQGWSSDSNLARFRGTRTCSYTWGEVALAVVATNADGMEERVSGCWDGERHECYRNLYNGPDYELQTKTFVAEERDQNGVGGSSSDSVFYSFGCSNARRGSGESMGKGLADHMLEAYGFMGRAHLCGRSSSRGSMSRRSPAAVPMMLCSGADHFFDDSMLAASPSPSMSIDGVYPLGPPSCRVQLWLRSAFPGWVNHVRRAAVAVTWKCAGLEKLVEEYTERFSKSASGYIAAASTASDTPATAATPAAASTAPAASTGV